MIEIAVIMALTAAVVEVIKHGLKKIASAELTAVLLPLIIVATASLLNVANMAIFDAAIGWREALKAGIVQGASTAGIYSAAKNIAEKFAAKRPS